MLGRCLSPFSFEMSSDLSESEVNQDKLTKRFLFLRKKLLHFWNLWRSEYLTDLREHHRLRNNPSTYVSEGELVLVHDDQTKRG